MGESSLAPFEPKTNDCPIEGSRQATSFHPSAYLLVCLYCFNQMAFSSRRVDLFPLPTSKICRNVAVVKISIITFCAVWLYADYIQTGYISTYVCIWRPNCRICRIEKNKDELNLSHLFFFFLCVCARVCVSREWVWSSFWFTLRQQCIVPRGILSYACHHVYGLQFNQFLERTAGRIDDLIVSKYALVWLILFRPVITIKETVCPRSLSDGKSQVGLWGYVRIRIVKEGSVKVAHALKQMKYFCLWWDMTAV